MLPTRPAQAPSGLAPRGSRLSSASGCERGGGGGSTSAARGRPHAARRATASRNASAAAASSACTAALGPRSWPARKLALTSWRRRQAARQSLEISYKRHATQEAAPARFTTRGGLAQWVKHTSRTATCTWPEGMQATAPASSAGGQSGSRAATTSRQGASTLSSAASCKPGRPPTRCWALPRRAHHMQLSSACLASPSRQTCWCTARPVLVHQACK
jgi:hypothetical protein